LAVIARVLQFCQELAVSPPIVGSARALEHDGSGPDSPSVRQKLALFDISDDQIAELSEPRKPRSDRNESHDKKHRGHLKRSLDPG